MVLASLCGLAGGLYVRYVVISGAVKAPLMRTEFLSTSPRDPNKLRKARQEVKISALNLPRKRGTSMVSISFCCQSVLVLRSLPDCRCCVCPGTNPRAASLPGGKARRERTDLAAYGAVAGR